MDWYLITFVLPWVTLPIAVAALMLAIKAARRLVYHDEVISRIVKRQSGDNSDQKQE